MIYNELLYQLKEITPTEFAFLQKIMSNMESNQAKQFVAFYSGKRQAPSDLLLYTLLGFIGVSGVHRFIIGNIGLGILYLITGGLCFVGTIIDAINHKNLALEHNRKAAYECAEMLSL